MVPQACRLADEAAAAAATLGLPVAMKVIAPDVLHKSDVGGVALGLATTDAVASAYERCRGGCRDDRQRCCSRWPIRGSRPSSASCATTCSVRS